MTVNPAIQTLYSAQLLANLDPAHVWTEACNSDYEGEIKGKGDVLRIFSVGRPTVGSTTTTGAAITYERIRPAPVILTIDQDKDWAIAEDHLEAMLEKTNTMQKLAKEGAWALVDASDQFIAFLMAAGAGATNTSAVVGNGATDAKPYDVIEEMRQLLKEKDVPSSDLHLFVPYWFMTKLRQQDRFTSFGTDSNRKTARGEAILELAGMTIHETSNALNSAGTGVDVDGPVNTIIAAWKGATTWGRHIPEEGLVQFFDSSSNVNNFDKLMRARYVYGATVVEPRGIVKMVVTKGS